MPRGAKLVVTRIGASSSDQKTVKRELGYDVAALYDVSLEKDGDTIQPYGEVEIGLPIPNHYQNGIVVICRINDDVSLDAFPTRRVGGMAYVFTDHFSKYAITVPQLDEAMIFRLPIWGIVLIAALLLVIISLIIVLLRRRNKATPVVESTVGQSNQISYEDLELFSFEQDVADEISPEEIIPQDLDNKQ